MTTKIISADEASERTAPFQILEREYEFKDMNGNITSKKWIPAGNPITCIPEVFPKETGRRRYRTVQYTNPKEEVKIYG